MELDPLLLSRIQFAFVVSFHAIFPIFTIGLAVYIAVLEGLGLRTGNPVYETLSRFWIRIFAVVFGMGVVSGIVMAFQFGTNWSAFSMASSNFLGPVLSYEVVTAFFLEATFLGVLLFGRGRVPRGTHLFAACMVAIGTMISMFWILSAASWMHTPTGTELRDGLIHLTSWREAVFNPSFLPRLVHMGLASFLAGGFVVAGVSAWYLRRNQATESSKKALNMCVALLAVIAPAQLVVGDWHGLNTLEHQPVKVAAMEGAWETQEGAPLLIFAIPSQEQGRNLVEIGIPNLASLILTHELKGEVRGLNEWPAEQRPPVAIVFWSFRLMVGIGLLLIVVSITALIQRIRGRLYDSPHLLGLFTLMIPLPFIAVLAGWFVTEIGRQPWVIFQVMHMRDGVTPSLTGGMALFTLIGYVLVYAAIFTAGMYYLIKLIREGPEIIEQPHQRRGHSKRPWSAVVTPMNGDTR